MKLVLERKAEPEWDPREHPRGRDGKFIRVGDRVKLSLGGTGRVLAITGNGQIAVQRDDGKRVLAKPEQVTQASAKPAFAKPTPIGTKPAAQTGKKPPGPAPAAVNPPAPAPAPAAVGDNDRVALPDGTSGRVVAVVGNDRVAVQRDDGGRAIHSIGEVRKEEAPATPAAPEKPAPTLAEAKKFIDDHYGQWREALSPKQESALRFYQSPGFALMNGQLRGLAKEDIRADVTFNDADLERARKASKELTAAIKKAPPLEEELTVYRGFSADQFGDLTPGQIITEKGFTSTSLTDDVAAVGRATSPAVATIRLPAGTKAGAGSSRELVLPPGSQFRISQASHRDGTLHVEMELVPATERPKTTRARKPKADAAATTPDISTPDTPNTSEAPSTPDTPEAPAGDQFTPQTYYDLPDPKITSLENRSLMFYRGNGYQEINRYLRENEGELDAVDDPDIKNHIRNLDRAIKRNKLDRDMTVYRGLSASYARDLIPDADVEVSAFSSTSMSRAKAEEFAGGGVIMAIDLPAGTNALKAFEGDFEILLPRGIDLTVDRVDPDGTVHVTLNSPEG